MFKPFVLFLSLTFLSQVSLAQIEVSYLKREKQKAQFGWGSYLHFGVPINQKSSVTADAGFIVSSKDDTDKGYVIAPVSLGYRYYLKPTGSSFFLEPQAGYCWGGADFVRKDENGNDVYEFTNGDGKPVYEESKGVLAGMNVGYHFSGKFSFDVALRYQRVFVSIDPSISVLSLRASVAIRNKNRN